MIAKASGLVSVPDEEVPLEEAPNAYKQMMAGKARFRIVLTMNPT
jgi:D-arabinose 1-dehydrogenase-like Zn-dependent alcohol dehydrogenase